MKLVGACACLALLAATGCRIDKHGSGNDDNVKITTPFGGLSVKTDDAAVQGSVGLPVYPGATRVKKEGDDSGAADVNMNFGNFHLGVKAVSYRTADTPDKVLAFYRKELGRYGSVILCHDNAPVGTPTHTQDGLTCSSDSQGTVHTDEHGSEGELKAGSKLHQHVVSVDRDGGGSKIGLVALDLPGNLDGKDGDSQ